MPIVPVEIFEMDRRQLLKMTGTMGVAATFIRPDELFAAGLCNKVDTSNGEVKAQAGGAQLQYFIDGLHMTLKLPGGSYIDHSAATDLPSRANLTVFMRRLEQKSSSFVESVVLMDENKQTIGARYFDESTKLQYAKPGTGNVPYVRFENVALDGAKKYYVVYTVREKSGAKLYAAVIDKPSRSVLTTESLFGFWPTAMISDFVRFLLGPTANPTPGLITTPFQFYTYNSPAQHSARGRVIEMASDGSSFKVHIEKMHDDQSDDHYMRYFVVMDPVGRIVGFHKRQNRNVAFDGVVTVPTAQQFTDFGFTSDQRDDIANIADCPYIQILTEDSYDAMARSMIRMR